MSNASLLNPKQKKILQGTIKEYFGIELFEYQLAFFYSCLTQQRVVGVFARQSGKSMTLALFIAWYMITHDNTKIIVIAPTDRQAGEIFQKIRLYVEGRALAIMVKHSTQREMEMVNSSNVRCFPVGDNGATIRGLTGDIIVQEEAAFIKDSIVNNVITPMGASTNAKFIKISTPFGMNHFYKSAFDKEWKLHQYGFQYALDAGLFQLEFIEKQQRDLTDMEFRTEYGAEFIADQDAYFKTETIEKSVADYKMITEVY